MLFGIVGGICAAIGALANKKLTENAAERKREKAFGKLTAREYHMKNNDVLRENMVRYGK